MFSRQKRQGAFQARSFERDAETDELRVKSVEDAVDAALRAAQAEYRGLSERINDVLARAAVTVGDATDEYVDREGENTKLQNNFSIEIANGERRLKDLEVSIGHFRSLKEAFAARFPHRQTDHDTARD
ncbi:hypothetical protein [Rhodopseudomonas sp. B29]|uniref:hypothetical protein n=1 Tax=Rhodopseudomonas sp. B29 TaxID=95607 RepID=UPI0003B75EE4|nr:hypothetical protein [Rhodopseudomonas sp. B29]